MSIIFAVLIAAASALSTFDPSVSLFRTTTLLSRATPDAMQNVSVVGVVSAVKCSERLAVGTASRVVLVPLEGSPMVVRDVNAGGAVCCAESLLYYSQNASVSRINVTSTVEQLIVGSDTSALIFRRMGEVRALAAHGDQLFAAEHDGVTTAISMYDLTAKRYNPFVRSPQGGLTASRAGYAFGTNSLAPSPEAFAVAVVALTFTTTELIYAEAGRLNKLWRVALSAPFAVSTICDLCTTATGSILVDGSFSTAKFGALSAVVALNDRLFVVGDTAATRLVDVVNATITTYAGNLLPGVGLRDGTADASFGLISSLATWDDYILVTDRGNEAVRIQQLVSTDAVPVPSAADNGANFARYVVSSNLWLPQTSLFAVAEPVWTAAQRGSQTLWTATVGNAASKWATQTPIACAIGGLAWSASASRSLLVSCSLQHVVLQFELTSRTFSWWCGKENERARVDAYCGDTAGTRFDGPSGITSNATGVFLADTNNQAVRFIDRDTRRTLTVAGNGTKGLSDGTLAQGMLENPVAVVTSCQDRQALFILGQGPGYATIRRLDLSTSVLTTVIGATEGTRLSGSLTLAVAGSILIAAGDSRAHKLHPRVGGRWVMDEIRFPAFSDVASVGSVPAGCTFGSRF